MHEAKAAIALAMARDLAPSASASTPHSTGLSERFGEPWEFASPVEMIVRPPFLDGQTIHLDGAMSNPLTEISPPLRT